MPHQSAARPRRARCQGGECVVVCRGHLLEQPMLRNAITSPAATSGSASCSTSWSQPDEHQTTAVLHRWRVGRSSMTALKRVCSAMMSKRKCRRCRSRPMPRASAPPSLDACDVREVDARVGEQCAARLDLEQHARQPESVGRGGAAQRLGGGRAVLGDGRSRGPARPARPGRRHRPARMGSHRPGRSPAASNRASPREGGDRLDRGGGDRSEKPSAARAPSGAPAHAGEVDAGAARAVDAADRAAGRPASSSGGDPHRHLVRARKSLAPRRRSSGRIRNRTGAAAGCGAASRISPSSSTWST